jgi:addiction module HigA family antidote
MMNELLKWPHPGQVLLEEWLTPMGLSQYALAKAIGVSPRRINEIVKGQRAITADTALRLAAFFGTDAQSWVNLQTDYDILRAKDTMSDVLAHIQRHTPKMAHTA